MIEDNHYDWGHRRASVLFLNLVDYDSLSQIPDSHERIPQFCPMIRYDDFFYKYFSRSITIERDFLKMTGTSPQASYEQKRRKICDILYFIW